MALDKLHVYSGYEGCAESSPGRPSSSLSAEPAACSVSKVCTKALHVSVTSFLSCNCTECRFRCARESCAIGNNFASCLPKTHYVRCQFELLASVHVDLPLILPAWFYNYRLRERELAVALRNINKKRKLSSDRAASPSTPVEELCTRGHEVLMMRMNKRRQFRKFRTTAGLGYEELVTLHPIACGRSG